MSGPGTMASSALPVGTRLGDFEITGVIGEGGFGIVYSATDLTLERVVAIKEYLPAALALRNPGGEVTVRSSARSDTFKAGLSSFLNEAKLLAKFSHPGLVEVHRFWEANGTAYMAMRYYRGVTLREMLRTNPEIVDEAWLCETLDPVLLALRELHLQSCYHRDVAPDNIMILPNGRSVLMDFGAARRIISGMSQALTTVLKPGYAPIEQYAEDGSMLQGAWTDIYAIGGVLYQAMSGRIPVQAVSRMMNDPLKPVASLVDGRFSQSFCDVVMKCLGVMPEQRYQSIDELRSALGWVEAPQVSTIRYRTPDPSPAPPVEPTTTTEAPPVEPTATSSPPPSVQAESSPANDVASSGDTALVADGSPSLLDAEIPNGPDGIDALINAPDLAPSLASHAGPVPAPSPAREPSPTLAPTLQPAVTTATTDSTTPSVPVSRAPAQGRKSRVAGAVIAGLLLLGVLGYFVTNRDKGGVDPNVVAQSGSPTSNAVPPAAPGANVEASTPAPALPGPATDAGTASVPQPATTPATAANSTSEAKVDASPAPPPSGKLDLRIKPWGNVTVDGVARGVSPPLVQLKLPPGSHEVTVENPASAAVTRTVEVRAGETLVFRHSF